MKIDINNLDKRELLALQNDVIKRIESIDQELIDATKRKDSVKNKTKICELTPNDRMFGIGFTNKLGVYFMGYCDVRGYSVDKEDSNWSNIGVGHKTHPFGLSTSITKEQSNEHYFLSYHCGDIMFFTMKPKRWMQDLQSALVYRIKQDNTRFNEEIEVLKKKIATINSSENEINKKIKKLK